KIIRTRIGECVLIQCSARLRSGLRFTLDPAARHERETKAHDLRDRLPRALRETWLCERACLQVLPISDPSHLDATPEALRQQSDLSNLPVWSQVGSDLLQKWLSLEHLNVHD